MERADYTRIAHTGMAIMNPIPAAKLPARIPNVATNQRRNTGQRWRADHMAIRTVRGAFTAGV